MSAYDRWYYGTSTASSYNHSYRDMVDVEMRRQMLRERMIETKPIIMPLDEVVKVKKEKVVEEDEEKTFLFNPDELVL